MIVESTDTAQCVSGLLSGCLTLCLRGMGQIQTTRNPHDITCELRRVLPRHSDILSAGPTPRRQSVKQPDSKPLGRPTSAVEAHAKFSPAVSAINRPVWGGRRPEAPR